MTTTASSDPGLSRLPWPDALAAALERAPRAVLVTVADARGSTPRESGAAMLVDGRRHRRHDRRRSSRIRGDTPCARSACGHRRRRDAGGDLARAVPAGRAPWPVLRRRRHARVADDRPRRRRLARDRPHLPAHAGAVRAGGDDRQRPRRRRATAGHRRRRPRHARRSCARIGGGRRGARAPDGESRSDAQAAPASSRSAAATLLVHVVRPRRFPRARVRQRSRRPCAGARAGRVAGARHLGRRARSRFSADGAGERRRRRHRHAGRRAARRAGGQLTSSS